jgi:hypothetical protein
MSIHNTERPDLCYCIFCRRKRLLAHYGAKPSHEAKAKDFLVMNTKRSMFILGPRSLLTGERKVVAQL